MNLISNTYDIELSIFSYSKNNNDILKIIVKLSKTALHKLDHILKINHFWVKHRIFSKIFDILLRNAYLRLRSNFKYWITFSPYD